MKKNKKAEIKRKKNKRIYTLRTKEKGSNKNYNVKIQTCKTQRGKKNKKEMKGKNTFLLCF